LGKVGLGNFEIVLMKQAYQKTDQDPEKNTSLRKFPNFPIPKF